jgi:hypothetical protein
MNLVRVIDMIVFDVPFRLNECVWASAGSFSRPVFGLRARA